MLRILAKRRGTYLRGGLEKRKLDRAFYGLSFLTLRRNQGCFFTFTFSLQDIGVGAFSVCKKCIHKASGHEYAVKVSCSQGSVSTSMFSMCHLVVGLYCHHFSEAESHPG